MALVGVLFCPLNTEWLPSLPPPYHPDYWIRLIADYPIGNIYTPPVHCLLVVCYQLFMCQFHALPVTMAYSKDVLPGTCNLTMIKFYCIMIPQWECFHFLLQYGHAKLKITSSGCICFDCNLVRFNAPIHYMVQCYIQISMFNFTTLNCLRDSCTLKFCSQVSM